MYQSCQSIRCQLFQRMVFEMAYDGFQNLIANQRGASWYHFETLPQTDDFRRAAVESTHTVQSVKPIARWKA